MEKDYKKQLTLKYKQVQRLVKEYGCYEKEMNKLNDKLKTEEESQVEEYYINKSKEYIKETKDTLLAVRSKVGSYLSELCELTNEINDTEIKESEEFKTATGLIEQATIIMNKMIS